MYSPVSSQLIAFLKVGFLSVALRTIGVRSGSDASIDVAASGAGATSGSCISGRSRSPTSCWICPSTGVSARPSPALPSPSGLAGLGCTTCSLPDSGGARTCPDMPVGWEVSGVLALTVGSLASSTGLTVLRLLSRIFLM